MAGIGMHEVIAVFLVMSLLAGPFWVFALLDILKSDFKEEKGKLTWFLVVFFLGIPGIIAYRLVGRKQKIAA